MRVEVLLIATLLGQTPNGFSHMEAAAFIVRDPCGELRLVPWPASDVADSAMWIGRVPDGVVAIAHTHPDWTPRPSRIDVSTSRTAQMPVYVVTRTQVWETAAGVTFRLQ